MAKKTSLENLAYKVIDGDKEAAKEMMMSISASIAYDDEGNLMSPRDIASNIVAAEEEPPPSVPEGVTLDKYGEPAILRTIEGGAGRNVGIQGYPPGQYQYRQEGREQVREGEAQRLAENISLLKKKSDMQDILLKIAAEDKELAEKTGEALMQGGITLTGAALGALPFLKMNKAIPLQPPDHLGDAIATGMGATILGTGGFGTGAVAVRGDKADRKEREATEKYRDIELSPDAQKLYDEYKTKGFSPTMSYYEQP